MVSWGRATVAPGSSSLVTRPDRRVWAPQAGGRCWEGRPVTRCSEAGWFCCCKRTEQEAGGQTGVWPSREGSTTQRQRQEKSLISLKICDTKFCVAVPERTTREFSGGAFRNLSEHKCMQFGPKAAARFKLQACWPCLPEAPKQLTLVHSEPPH